MSAMNVKSGAPFWALKNGLMTIVPRLEQDRRCDVCVIGGGITGAIIADELTRHGHDVVLVEQRELAWGSTAASTALLQYEIDTPLVELIERYGEGGVAAYRACVAAIDQLRVLATSVKDTGFAMAGSLYLASRERDVDDLSGEQTARKAHGLPSTWLDPGEIRERFQIEAPAALFTEQAATVDPYRFASRLFARTKKRGAAIHDRTRIASVRVGPRDVTLRTDQDVTIRARHVIVAAGYEAQRWLSERVARNRSSYAIMSDPMDPGVVGNLAHTVVWETARPYLYLRSTPDCRILAGGLDDRVDIPLKRDARVTKRAAQLVERARELLPHIPTEAAFAWAGTFAETDDGLPYFGAHPQHGPRVLFAMAYGGNGITYSMLGAGLLRAAIERRPHPLSNLLAFGRLDRARS